MLKIHSLPESQVKSNLYGITVNGNPVVAEFSRVSAMPFNTPWPGHQRDKSQTEESPFISFEADENVEICVTSKEKIEKVFVRPLSKEVKYEIISDNTVKFELSKFGGYVLEINGLHNPLNIFFNPVRDFAAETKAKEEQGRKVYYFAPGVYEIGEMEIESHSTVTIDGGAIVYGNISAFNAEDVEINGYGVIDGSCEIRDAKEYRRLLIPVFANSPYWKSMEYDPENPYFVNDKKKFDAFMEDTKCLKGILRFYFCNNVRCEGIILRDSSTFGVVPAVCDNVIFDNIKIIGFWRYNSDGIDLFNSINVEIKNCFVRNFDDSIVIKGILGWDFQNNENIVVDNCVVWCDWGAALEIGAETNAPEYKNIVYKNCDLLYDAAGSMMRIHHHNRAKISNVKYENIHVEFHIDQMNTRIQHSDDEEYEYIEGQEQPAIITLTIPPEILYGPDGTKSTIRDIEFKNIYMHIEEGIVKNPDLHFRGYNADCTVDGVKLINFYKNGKMVDDISELSVIKNDFAFNIEYNKE